MKNFLTRLVFCWFVGVGVGRGAALPIPSSRSIYPVDAEVFIGPQLGWDNIQKLTHLHIRTILSLQNYILSPLAQSVEENIAQSYGMQYLIFPMSAIPNEPPSVSALKIAANAMADPRNRPIYVHCMLGIDRAGFLAAAYLVWVRGWEASRAIEYWQSIGHQPQYEIWDGLLYQLASDRAEYFQEHPCHLASVRIAK